MIIDEPGVTVKTAEVVDLQSFTQLRLEYLPAVIPQPVVEEAAVAAPPPELEPPAELPVPYYVQQQLIYHWIKHGRRDMTWRIAPELPPMIDNSDGPVVTPLFGREQPRQIGHFDDGVRRRVVLQD